MRTHHESGISNVTNIEALTTKKRLEKYNQDVSRIQSYALKRMGHPYVGPVYGYFTETGWEANQSSPYKLIDTACLGIIPGSPADTYINNSGSPYTKSRYIQRDVKDIEVDIMNIMARFYGVGYDDIRGYITAGATEASLSCLWWLREGLRQSSKDKVHLLLSDHSHYSLKKIGNILGLDTTVISAAPEGELDLINLKQGLEKLIQDDPFCRVIMSLNVGTTEFGATDDIPNVHQMLRSFKQKYPNFEFRIHVDAALLGLTLPILQPFGDTCIFDYADTLIFSGHKLLGTTTISGIAMARKHVWEEAFSSHSTSVNYVAGIEDTTVLGSRSGYPVIEFHHALCSLNIDTDFSKLKKVINSSISNANYLASSLRKIVPDSEVTCHKNQFNVTFPSPELTATMLSFCQRYGLMRVRNNRLGVSILAHVNRNLIHTFLKEYESNV